MPNRKFVKPPEEVVRLCHKLGIEKVCLYIPAISRYRGKYEEMILDILKWMHVQYIQHNVFWNKKYTAKDSKQIRYAVAKRTKIPIAYKLVNRAKERWKKWYYKYERRNVEQIENLAYLSDLSFNDLFMTYQEIKQYVLKHKHYKRIRSAFILAREIPDLFDKLLSLALMSIRSIPVNLNEQYKKLIELNDYYPFLTKVDEGNNNY